jgi:ornithine carbamoyltransferase
MSNLNDFLSVADLEASQVGDVVVEAAQIKTQMKTQIKNGEDVRRPLEGMTVALLFEKPSLRTRGSFEVGIRQLGGDCVYFSPDDVGLGKREPVADVARVLDRWFDCVVARVFSHDALVEMAEYASIPVVNALSDVEHPCQAMADLLTVHEKRGSLAGAKIAYVGDGNNVAASLAIACGSVGAHFTIASPKGYQVPEGPWSQAQSRAKRSSGSVTWMESPHEAVVGADAVYTDVWVSMGEESDAATKLQAFKGYQVGPELMDRAGPNAVFMHDLPAHEGEEIAPGMLDHPRSVVFDQAENRLHAQKAVLSRLMTQG